ncbi:MAG: nucleotidyl transferase AbiEii/AbiGii toxin family protein [bacterium]|nr:nucleotidyl transferase AbiEii/AbiGii toxin family protein [bacterium]
MLSIKDIATYYSPAERVMDRNIFREYLQYQILYAISQSALARKLSFLGGTSLRLIYNNPRFSEDLDFDNFGLSDEEFTKIADDVRSFLEEQGYTTEIQTIHRGAFRCNVRFPGILFENNLSPLRDEKVLIQIDSTAHNYSYIPDISSLEKFGTALLLQTTPLALLFAQKILAVFNRPRMLGRDFFDIAFILGRDISPDYKYLQIKLDINSADELRSRIQEKIKDLRFMELAQDVDPFVYDKGQLIKVSEFQRFWKEAKL